jgi:hypothetical protein
VREGSYADLMAKRGRRSTPAQLSSAIKKVKPAVRPTPNSTLGSSSYEARKEESTEDEKRGGISFPVARQESAQSPKMFRAPESSKANGCAPSISTNPASSTETRPMNTSSYHTPSSQQSPLPARLSGKGPLPPPPLENSLSSQQSPLPTRLPRGPGTPEARSSRIAHLQKFVDRVLLRSEEHELGEGQLRTKGGHEKDAKEEEDAVTLTTIHQVRRSVLLIVWLFFADNLECNRLREGRTNSLR